MSQNKARKELIKKIEQHRTSKVICFLTSLRPGVPSAISDDCVRVFFDHLLLFPKRPIDKLDIFLCSNGGSGTVPWRLVALFREHAKSFNVIIPYRAYSAASLLALGADEIVMHPFAELGPIDPSVSNEFNPTDPTTGQRMAISVEDVRAYVNFIKSTVGISHEDELIKAIEILVQKVHPLAIGNVERFISQSRMIARKILRTHMKDASNDHVIEEIVENMASKLFFHGHPINRLEAKTDLKLKVCDDLKPDFENTIWKLYLDFETEFKNTEAFNPAMELASIPAPAPTPTVPAASPQPPAAPAPAAPGQPVTPAPAVSPVPFQFPPQFAALLQQATAPPEIETELLHAMIESEKLTSRFTTRRRFTKLPAAAQAGQVTIREDLLSQGWSHS